MWALNKHSSQNKGFTIVELLIVIVVIGILAAIVIVAFNGVQDRSRWAKTQSDLASINKAIQMYYAEKGEYPATAAAGSWSWRYSCQTDPKAGPNISNAFIPSISSVASNLPQAPCRDAGTGNDTWLYGSDGAEYKLIHIRPAHSASIRSLVPTNLQDPFGTRWSADGSWGYWSPGAANR
jgi:prepilin-type N-terminal cleavage/methylation domain